MSGFVPAGAFYLDLAYEQDGSILGNPIIINNFPHDDEVGVPAADINGAHPLHLTVVDIVGTDGLKAGQTNIYAVIGYLATYSSPTGSDSSSIETADDLIEVKVKDEISISEEVLMGIKEGVFNGTTFSSDWDSDSSYSAVASDGGLTIDEHRFILVKESAFLSLQTVVLEVYAETDNVSPDVLSTSYRFTIEDLTKPELISVATLGLKTLIVTFNEAMTQGTGVAGDATRIKDISGGVAIYPPEGSLPARIVTSREIFESSDVGLYLGIAGAENALNNDIFQIVSFISETMVEISSIDVIAETLPIDAIVTVSPYRVNGIPDSELVIPYFNPVVIAAEMISSEQVELTLHTEITPNRAYNFYGTSVEDLNGNALDPVYIEFVTEALNIPVERENEGFNIPEMIPWGNRRPEEDATRDLARFLNCLDEVFQLLLYDIDRFPDIIDIDLLEGGNLDAMLVHLGAPFSFSGSLSEAEKRRLAAILVDAYKRKGIEVGMEAMIAYVLGFNVDVRPYYDPDSFWILGLSALGSDTVLGPGSEFLKYSFEVESSINLTETQRRRLVEIVEWMKPAHTHFVRLLEPGYQMVINDLLYIGDQVSAVII